MWFYSKVIVIIICLVITFTVPFIGWFLALWIIGLMEKIEIAYDLE